MPFEIRRGDKVAIIDRATKQKIDEGKFYANKETTILDLSDPKDYGRRLIIDDAKESTPIGKTGFKPAAYYPTSKYRMKRL